MGFLLDKLKAINRVGVVAELPSDSEGNVIAEFFSTFDDEDTQVLVNNVEQRGQWLLFEITDNNVPDRSGRYRVQFSTTEIGSIPLSELLQPFSEIDSPLKDLQGFQKNLVFAETVADIKNATNEFFRSQGRTLTYTERTVNNDFKEYERDEEFKTRY